jgi:phosphatidate phosphatase APP1
VGWKKAVTLLVAKTERKIDELRYGLYYSLGGPGPIKIVPYRGYGTSKRLYLKGRVLEDKNISEADEDDRIWNNLVSMYKRLQSDEVPNARLKARFDGQEYEVTANFEGFFEVWIEPQRPLPEDRLWHQVELELVEPIPDRQPQPVIAVGEILVPPPSARFVVISDIDDTVLQTDATHVLRMARNVFLGNAHTRLPFEGVAGLYRALFAGDTGQDMNPLLYVSSSPWNLYDLLAQFFRLNDIPLGPVLFLRDWGISEEEILPLKHGPHKIAVIRQMLDFYPDLPFILMGDSGQEDPEIYAKIAEEYPERVLAIYIRNVSRSLKRPEAINELAEKVIQAGSALVLAEDSMGIAKHALERKFIAPDAIPMIQAEKEKDEAPPTPLEKFLHQDAEPEAPTVEVTSGEPDNLTKEPPHSSGAKKAVEEGAVEETLKEAGKEETSRPPTVVVDSKEAKEKAEKDAKPGEKKRPVE